MSERAQKMDKEKVTGHSRSKEQDQPSGWSMEARRTSSVMVNPHAQVIALQKTVGNKATSGLIQRVKEINETVKINGYLIANDGIFSNSYVKSSGDMFVGNTNNGTIHAGKLKTPSESEK